jgi:hypothetical protein
MFSILYIKLVDEYSENEGKDVFSFVLGEEGGGRKK